MFSYYKTFYFILYTIWFLTFSHLSADYNLPSSDFEYGSAKTSSDSNYNALNFDHESDKILFAIQNMTQTLEQMTNKIEFLSQKLLILHSIEDSFKNVTTQILSYKNIITSLNQNLEPLAGIENSFAQINDKFGALEIFFTTCIIVSTSWLTWHFLSYCLTKISPLFMDLKCKICNLNSKVKPKKKNQSLEMDI